MVDFLTWLAVLILGLLGGLFVGLLGGLVVLVFRLLGGLFLFSYDAVLLLVRQVSLGSCSTALWIGLGDRCPWVAVQCPCK